MLEKAVDLLSSTTQTYKEGMKIQSAIIQRAKDAINAKLSPMIQMLKDSVVSLQTSVQMPRGPTKLPPNLAQYLETLVEISQNSVQYLEKGKREQLAWNQIFERALASQSNSIQSYRSVTGTQCLLFSIFGSLIDPLCFQHVFDGQLDLIQLLKGAMGTLCPLIQALKSTTGTQVFKNAAKMPLCSIRDPPKA